MKEPRWLRDSVVDAIHRRQLAEHGGLDGIRDRGILSSAIARPQKLLAYGNPAPDLAALAASYAFGIACNHPFVDGNQRTAYVACRAFLKLNGQNIDAPQAGKYLTFLGIADGSISEAQLATWIRDHSTQLRRGS